VVQISILSGVYSQRGPDFERSYPVNLVPNVEETGISQGYLRSAPGIDNFSTGRGKDGGGTYWPKTGLIYRISGTKLISVSSDGTMAILGTVGGSGQGSLAYSFDNLLVARNNNLYLYNPTDGFRQVTDVDLGEVIDVVWMDGYDITTDGTSIVVSELNDPTAVDPLKYGSSEADPDPIMGLGERRGELIAFNRYTTEFFFNAGTTGFPFQRNRGAQIDKGAVGTHAKCKFLETYAMVGSGRNEQPQVYLLGEGQASAISTREIDRMLALLSDDDLSSIILEAREGDGAKDLYLHLPGQTLVYSQQASQQLETQVWYRLASGTDGLSPYRARNFVLAYGQWHCGDLNSSALGVLTDLHDNQFGEQAAWQFDAQLIYSQGRGGVCHNLELVGFYGRADPGVEPRVFMCWTDDGVVFSQERAARSGFTGQRSLRLAWRRNGFIRQWRSFRFRGISGTPGGFSRLEAELEPLNG
jgi:hypothetical protein